MALFCQNQSGVRKTLFTIMVLGTLFVTMDVRGEWSATLSGATDYLFNGVTQTKHQPAIQGSVDWADASGFYAGTWVSNVDFGDDTEVEIDLYAGYLQDLTENIALESGVALYSYHGGNDSSDSNYPEIYAKLGVGSFFVNLWYTHDYSGLNAPHIVSMLGAEWAPSERLLLTATLDRSTSLDGNRFSWQENRDHYYHWQLTADTSQLGLDLRLGLSGTDLEDSSGDTTVFFSISRTFNF